ncbi:hypothetical protein LCGC14_2017790 [marine sediment metagenome]|uniref:Uncharacterized protein n=1 Tax=marine sediment metagenome TaxID=412755 RepID=A0A0F9HVJ3_9ZZZZ
MKKYLFILILSISLPSVAQEYITIPDKDAAALKQYKVNWHTGIDPVQIKDSSWVLPIEVIDLIPSDIRILDANEKIVANDLREYLISKPKRTLTKAAFIEATLEPKIIEMIK